MSAPIRLFNTEDSEYELEAALSPEGRRAKAHIEATVETLISEMSTAGYNLRDVEVLALSAVQMSVARAIIMRRRKEG